MDADRAHAGGFATKRKHNRADAQAERRRAARTAALACRRRRVQDEQVTERQEATAMLKTTILSLSALLGLGLGAAAAAQTAPSASLAPHAVSTAAATPSTLQFHLAKSPPGQWTMCADACACNFIFSCALLIRFLLVR